MLANLKGSFAKLVVYCLVNNLSSHDASNLVAADQPVHCKCKSRHKKSLTIWFPSGLRGQVYGVWNFHVSQKSDIVNLFKVEEVCTHKLPNK